MNVKQEGVCWCNHGNRNEQIKELLETMWQKIFKESEEMPRYPAVWNRRVVNMSSEQASSWK